MSPMTGNAEQSLLDRFTDALARIVHEERPDALSRPITVAELYQDIAPYRRLRELAGIEMHADYEHALIRFLAGEGGYALLDPENAADELGIEAESSDPDLSLYRKFAACDVRLSLPRPTGEAAPRRVVELPPVEPLALRPPLTRPARAEEKAEPAMPEAIRPAPPSAEPATLEETMRALSMDAPAVSPPRRPPATTSARSTASAHAPAAAARCGFCGQGLPAARHVSFCPHCGVDLTARQCGACGEAMEEGWRFCVACGAAAES
jgi:hypothetical protein